MVKNKNLEIEERCWAQVKEDWCNNPAIKNGYCMNHAIAFGEMENDKGKQIGKTRKSSLKNYECKGLR